MSLSCLYPVISIEKVRLVYSFTPSCVISTEKCILSWTLSSVQEKSTLSYLLTITEMTLYRHYRWWYQTRNYRAFLLEKKARLLQSWHKSVFSTLVEIYKKKKLFTRMYTLSLSPSHTHTSHKHILSHQTHTRCFHANQKLAHKSFFNTFRGLKRIHTSILVCVWRENERKSA